MDFLILHDDYETDAFMTK